MECIFYLFSSNLIYTSAAECIDFYSTVQSNLVNLFGANFMI